jgi:hypothetical protein
MTMLVDVLPQLPAKNLRDCVGTHTVLGGKCGRSISVLEESVLRTNLTYLLLSQLRPAMGDSSRLTFRLRMGTVAIPSWSVAPTLRLAVTRIVAGRSSEKMPWVHTDGIVAAVASEHIRWQLTHRKHESDSMGSDKNCLIAKKKEVAVALPIASALPGPARIRSATLVNAAPELFNLFRGKINGHCSLHNCGATVGGVPAPPGHFVQRIIPQVVG